jgi:CDP-6-deoxy-D-xylo-4-hexulose-3-dehydrase
MSDETTPSAVITGLPPSGSVHDEREIEAVVEVMRSTNLSIGVNVAEFESRIATLLAKRYGVMVNSGSSALRLAIDLLGCEPGDEIITSPLTFSTDISPMVHSGIVPVFVDVEPDSFQVDPARIAEMVGPRTKAILAPNLVGNCPDWDAIRVIADEHGLMVIEDSCDVLDSWLGGTRTGSRADLVVTSFALSHAMTCGGNGGMVGIDDDALRDRCLSLRRWGRRSESYLYGSRQGEADRFGPLADGTPYDLVFVFDDVGYNFEPTEWSAAFGLVQLDKLDDFNGLRRHNWTMLDEFFAGHEDRIVRPRTTEGCDTTWMRYCFQLREDSGLDRTEVQEFLEARNVATRMIWTGNVLRQPGFAHIEHRAPDDGLPNADRVMDAGLTLPIHHGLTSDHVGFMVDQLAQLLGR